MSTASLIIFNLCLSINRPSLSGALLRLPLLVRLLLFINGVISLLRVVVQDPTRSCSGTTRYCFVMPFHARTPQCVGLFAWHIGDVPLLCALALKPRVIHVIPASKTVHQVVMLLNLVTKRLVLIAALSWVLELLASSMPLLVWWLYLATLIVMI